MDLPKSSIKAVTVGVDSTTHKSSTIFDPRTTQEKSIQPKVNQPKANQPKANQPKANQPKANQSKANQPKANQPKTNQSNQSITTESLKCKRKIDIFDVYDENDEDDGKTKAPKTYHNPTHLLIPVTTYVLVKKDHI